MNINALNVKEYKLLTRKLRIERILSKLSADDALYLRKHLNSRQSLTSGVESALLHLQRSIRDASAVIRKSQRLASARNAEGKDLVAPAGVHKHNQ